jgi:hypothetical protein
MMQNVSTILEKHFTPKQVADLWGMHPMTVRRLFENEPDVMKLVRPETLRKRKHTSYWISESAMRRVNERLCRKG